MESTNKLRQITSFTSDNTLADKNSKNDWKICWTAWNLTFSHRFGTRFSQGWKIFRDAYDAMVKTTYFQLIRTKKTHSRSKKTAGGQQKTGAKCSLQASKWSLQASKEHWGAFRSIEKISRKHLKLFPKLKNVNKSRNENKCYIWNTKLSIFTCFRSIFEWKPNCSRTFFMLYLNKPYPMLQYE